MARFTFSEREWCLHYGELLESKTEKTDGCWLFTGRKDKSGYGIMDVVIPGKGKTVRTAHKLVCMVNMNCTWKWPPKLEASHLCARPECIRLEHLVMESHSDNKSRQICHRSGFCAPGKRHNPKCIIVHDPVKCEAE